MERRRDMLQVTPSTVARMLAEIEIITGSTPEQLYYRKFIKFDDLEILLQFDEEDDGNKYGVFINSVDQNDEIANSISYQIDPAIGEVRKYINDEDPIETSLSEMNILIGLLAVVDRGRSMSGLSAESIVNYSLLEGLFSGTIEPRKDETRRLRAYSSGVLSRSAERLARQGQETICKRLNFKRGNCEYTIEMSKLEEDTFARVTIDPKLPGTEELREQFTIYRDGKCKHSFDFPKGLFGVRSDRIPEVFKLNKDAFIAYELEALEFERRRLAPLVKRARS